MTILLYIGLCPECTLFYIYVMLCLVPILQLKHYKSSHKPTNKFVSLNDLNLYNYNILKVLDNNQTNNLLSIEHISYQFY